MSEKKLFLLDGHALVYRAHYAFGWTVLFLVIGQMVFRSTQEAKSGNMPYGISYSLDMLIPLVKLRELHYTIDLRGAARYYFYFHKIMGYVLASFLVAALTGLTK